MPTDGEQSAKEVSAQDKSLDNVAGDLLKKVSSVQPRIEPNGFTILGFVHVLTIQLREHVQSTNDLVSQYDRGETTRQSMVASHSRALQLALDEISRVETHIIDSARQEKVVRQQERSELETTVNSQAARIATLQKQVASARSASSYSGIGKTLIIMSNQDSTASELTEAWTAFQPLARSTVYRIAPHLCLSPVVTLRPDSTTMPVVQETFAQGTLKWAAGLAESDGRILGILGCGSQESEAMRQCLKQLATNPFDNIHLPYQRIHFLLLLQSVTTTRYPVGPSQRIFYSSITQETDTTFTNRCLAELKRRSEDDQEDPEYFIGLELGDKGVPYCYSYHPKDKRIVYYGWEAIGEGPGAKHVRAVLLHMSGRSHKMLT